MASQENKVIGITGSASGMGLSLAMLLVSRGATVSIADINKDGLEKAGAAIKDLAKRPEQVHAAQVDVTKPEQLNSWVGEIVQKFGKLDGAANMAGILGKGTTVKKTHEIEQDSWDQLIAINMTGVMNSMRAELNVMKSGAAIVNAGSAAGLHGSIAATAYCASKHAVHGMTKCAAKEYGAAGIRVNAVAPGYVWTPFEVELEKAVGREALEGAVKAMPMPRYGQPEEIANVCAFLLSEESSFMTGAIVSVDGGWHT